MISLYLSKEGTEFTKNLGAKDGPDEWIKFDKDGGYFIGFILAP